MGSLAETLRNKLTPYQYQLVADPADRIIVRKSRRTGFTWAQALRMVLLCMSGRNQNIISYRYDSSKLVIEDCTYWIDFLISQGLTQRKNWDMLKGAIHHRPSGASITALPCVPRVIRGRKGDVFIDEAAWIPELPELLAAVRPLQMWGGKLTLVSSPFMSGTFTDLCDAPGWSTHTVDIYDAVRGGLYHVIQSEAGMNPPTDSEVDAWVEELIRESGKSAPQEYLCQDVGLDVGGWITQDTVFVDVPVFRPESTVTHSLPSQVPHSIGVDVGVSDHPTVIATVGSSGLVSLVEVRGWTLPRIAELLASLVNDHTQTLSIDSNGVGRGLADELFERYPQITKHTPNTSQWLSKHAMGFLGRVWQGTASISSDPLVASDLANTGVSKGQLKFTPYRTHEGIRHCDSIPAMAMAYQYQPSTTNGIHGVWG